MEWIWQRLLWSSHGPEFLPNNFSSTHANFTSFSLVGLNLGARINDQFSAVAQLLALGTPIGSADPFALVTQWAYLKYSPLNGFNVKAGRQLMPFLMSSEYARVGLLLPFRQQPIGLFIEPFTRFDGLSVEQDFNIGIGQLAVHLFGGSPQLDLSPVGLPPGQSFFLSDMYGLALTLDGIGWRVRAQGSVNRGGETLPNPPIGPGGRYDAFRESWSLGGRYDKHNVVVWAEYVASVAPQSTTTNYGGRFIEHGEGYYGLVGYRIDKFLPRYTYSRGSNDFNISGLHGQAWNGDIDSHTFGVNYQATPNVVLKAEFERQFIGSPDTAGNFGVNQLATTASPKTHGDALYIGTDFIF